MTVTIEWMTNRTLAGDTGGDTVDAVYGILDLDAVIVETYDLGADITEHPIEDGESISDHVRPALNRVSMNIIISNTPIASTLEHPAGLEDIKLDLPDRIRIARGAIGISIADFDINLLAHARLGAGGFSAGIGFGIGIGFATTYKRSELEKYSIYQGVRVLKFSDDQFDRCQEVYDQLTELKNTGTVINVIGARFGDLEGYLIRSISIPIENDNSMNFNLDIQELKTARTETVDAPSPRVERGRPRANNGGQTGTDEQDGNANGRSVAQGIYDQLQNSVPGLPDMISPQ